MNFTTNMVYGALNAYRVSKFIQKDNTREYRWISLLPENSHDMERDILYVCLMTEALKRNKENQGFHYLCICDRYWDNDQASEFSSGMIVINENKDVAWLLNLVQQRFLRLSEWETNMQLAIIDNCSYQRLLDLCEPILCNFVSVLDSTYKLLAHTTHQKSDDPINVSLLEKGYHTEETIRKFQSQRRLKLYAEEHGLIFGHAGEISIYDTVCKWCHYGGENLLQTVMVCSNTPLSDELTELFDVLMKYIDICFQREQRQLLTPSKIYSSLMHDIIYENLSNPYRIADQAKRSGIPYISNFDFYKIVFEDIAIVPIGRFIQELSSYLPFSKIISQDFEICVLNIYDSPKITEYSHKNIEKIMPLLEKYKGICGVSESFSCLAELKMFAHQATCAFNIGIKLYNLGNHWSLVENIFESVMQKLESRVFYYNDIYVFHILQCSEIGSADLFTNSPYTKSLKTLMEYDKEHDGNLIEILYCYLLCERRPTAVGNILHMHRNTVLYHIGRIIEIIGTDLDDYWVRLKLMLAFHYLELQAANIKSNEVHSGK
ncbi:PucR C-terminal helix-turn-helix domain-containing protein [Sporobacter termitidis DSM 10068]|uniref:PucR C-terminal helix-turn-helix domain-containing protein n=1 Tax=Sporobacter termitidis DSM 10068 TaxID=1123282 RepID=A0A1M5XV97_9FIRM|nr:helix-turn-helix domain-containing protein [Sporobacter termitidis]SHI03765.1 PucR C-terminal helix-turn-helix domain-containing protein [Sporobacter termitidis DSM 10068]